MEHLCKGLQWIPTYHCGLDCLGMTTSASIAIEASRLEDNSYNKSNQDAKTFIHPHVTCMSDHYHYPHCHHHKHHESCCLFYGGTWTAKETQTTEAIKMQEE